VTVLRGILQFCILGLFGASLAIYRPTEFISIAGVCFFFGVLFAATFLLGTGAAEKLTERQIFLAFESFALVVVVGGVLSVTGNLFIALILALAVWWGLMLAILVHPAFGHFNEEKEFFHSLSSKEGSWLSRLHKFAFAFFYAPIFVKKEFYFWGFMALAVSYLVGKHFR
jgi:hypothetical protein